MEMADLKIGALLESFRLGVRGGMAKAAELGLRGFQVSGAQGDLAFDQLTRTGRRDFLNEVRHHGLEISALLANVGSAYGDPAVADELVEKTCRVVDLSVDLGVAVLTNHIGVIPEDPSSPTWRTMAESLRAVAEYAARYGGCLAAETGPESPELMRKFLEDVNCDGLGINYDPANLVMKGFDPIAGVRELGRYVVHTHAKDAVQEAPEGQRREVPLGKGEVPWREYLAVLAESGYQGYFTIERETGEDPASDIAEAKRFLETL